MKTAKHLAGALATMLLPVMLFVFGIHVSVYHILGSAVPLKTALDESNIYEVVIEDLLGAAQQDPDNPTIYRIRLSQPAVQQVIKASIPPKYLQEQTEAVIENVYAWLHGETEGLLFKIDLQEAKVALADGMATYTLQHVSSLPTCQSVDPTMLNDPLNASCVPPGFDPAIASQQIRQEILSNANFLQDTTITAADTVNSEGKTWDEQFARVPMLYERVRWGTYITGILSVVFALIMIYGADSRRTGIKRAALMALVIGAATAGASWAVNLLIDNIMTNLVAADNTEHIRSSLLHVGHILLHDIWIWWIGYGLALAGIGLLALAALRLTRGPQATTPITATSGKEDSLPDTPAVQVDDVGSREVGKKA